MLLLLQLHDCCWKYHMWNCTRVHVPGANLHQTLSWHGGSEEWLIRQPWRLRRCKYPAQDILLLHTHTISTWPREENGNLVRSSDGKAVTFFILSVKIKGDFLVLTPKLQPFPVFRLTVHFHIVAELSGDDDLGIELFDPLEAPPTFRVCLPVEPQDCHDPSNDTHTVEILHENRTLDSQLLSHRSKQKALILESMIKWWLGISRHENCRGKRKIPSNNKKLPCNYIHTYHWYLLSAPSIPSTIMWSMCWFC